MLTKLNAKCFKPNWINTYQRFCFTESRMRSPSYNGRRLSAKRTESNMKESMYCQPPPFRFWRPHVKRKHSANSFSSSSPSVLRSESSTARREVRIISMVPWCLWGIASTSPGKLTMVRHPSERAASWPLFDGWMVLTIKRISSTEWPRICIATRPLIGHQLWADPYQCTTKLIKFYLVAWFQ